MKCPACGRPNSGTTPRCDSCGAGLSAAADDSAGSPTRVDPAPPGFDVPVSGALGAGASLGSRYELQELLGRGGMGAVYKAHDRVLNRTVAIKVIRPEMASRPEVLERFKREITLASKVSHRNVVRIHDLGEVGDSKFLSMNFVDGSDLKQILKREGPMSVERALPLVRQIGEALAAAHEAGVVHRDLKPQNILIDRDGNAFIADFGISRSTDAGGTITELGSVLGTVDYMAPEQARGERSDHRGDIYSFGVILFEIFTGTLPFAGGDALSVMMKRLHEVPPPVRRVRRQVPAWLSEIVARALQRDPADRYQTIAELLRDLEQRHASASWRRIRRRLLPVAAGLGIAAAIYGGVLYWRSRPSVAAGPSTSLALLPFQNGTGDARYDWAREGIPSLLRDYLLQAGSLRLVGEERVREVLGTLKTVEGDEARPATMRKIAGVIGTDHVLAGRLLKIADRLRIEASLEQAGLSDAAGPLLRVDGAGDDAIPVMLAELAQRVQETLGVSRGWLARAREATEPSTHSAEAIALHGRALDLLRAGRNLDASKLLEQTVGKDPDFAVARVELAETYDALGWAEKSAEEAKKAAASLGSASPFEAARVRAALARLAGDLDGAERAYESLCEITPGDAGAYYDLAAVREERGDLEGALTAFRRVVALDPKHPDGHLSLGRVLYKLGNPTEATQELNVALGLHEESDNDEGKATVLNGLGSIYLGLGEYGEALPRFERSLEIRRRIGDQKGVAKTQSNIAVILGRQGRYPEAISASREALEFARRIGDPEGIANNCSELGNVYLMAGQPELAMPAFQESLQIFRGQGGRHPAGEARALANISAANTVLGRYGEASYALRDALAKRREIGDKSEIIPSLSDLGDNERFQGGFEEALKYYTEGRALAREMEDRAHVIVFLVSVANVHEAQGNYGAALALLAESEPLARESKDDTMLAASLTSLGSVRCRVGDLAGAEAALAESLRLARETRNPCQLAETSGAQAILRLAEGARDRAAALSAEALVVANQCGDHRLALVARLQAGEIARSAREVELVAKEAESTGLAPIAASAHLALARIRFAAGGLGDALREADLAVARATRLGQREILFEALHLAGACLAKQGDRSGAADRFAAALVPLEEMRGGLPSDARPAFLARPEIVAFGRNAKEVFAATSRREEAGRLEPLLRP